ncbi:MAG: flagellar hook-length control protein FliK [Selenomonadaceae bacterium]|nr:flagellar hook-length control protein FliK [Selenomonadaceae bacterium]
MATTATTNLMSLNAQPLKSASSSLRQASTQKQLQYRNNYSDQSFDKVFDRYNDTPYSTNDDVKDMSYDKVQETKDPVVAAVSTSAQGKSKKTQDAPQKDSQPVEEVTEIEEVEDPSDPKKAVVVNMFAQLSVEDPNLNLADLNISEDVGDDSPNLMTILPQSQESNDKGQDMLNLLAGRTWKINSQNQSVNQVESQVASTFADDLSMQLGNQQQSQTQNNLLVGNNPLMLQELTVQRNFLEINPQMSLNNVDINSSGMTEEVGNLTNLINSNEIQTENLNPIISSENSILNETANTQSEVPVPIVSQTEQQNISSAVELNIGDEAQQQLTQEQLTVQNNGDNEQPLVSVQQGQVNTNAQPLQQQQTQSSLQTSSQVSTNETNPSQQSDLSVNGQAQFVSDSQVQAPAQEQSPVHQARPQNVTYQAQQAQPAAQAENVEVPQVQAAIAENQPNVINRQQTIQSNFVDLANVKGELDQSQTVNPSQQTLQQQSQNQQQQNFQSQMQQSATTEVETEGSSNTSQQAPTENFATHLGAAVNNTNNDPINVSNEPLEQTEQTARQENITTQIVEHAKMIRNAENTEMVIQLKPEHLGELTLRVSATTNGSVNVTFHSENAQVRAMLENTLVQLKQELSNQGLKVENVQVSAHLSDGGMMNGRGQQAWEQNQRSNNSARIGRIGRTEGGSLTAAEEAELISTAVPENIVTADSVDYRV